MVDHSIGKPYEIIDFGENWEVRLFRNEDPSQLFWHRDKEDRYIHLIYGDVEIQFDNELPNKIRESEVFIKRNMYHRVISDKPFILKIYK